MRLSNFEQTKLDYYNRKLGNTGAREFDYFSLDEALSLYQNDKAILNDLSFGDPAYRRFLETTTLLSHYHELLHKKGRANDAAMVYRFACTHHPEWKMQTQTYSAWLHALAALCEMKITFVVQGQRYCHLWPTEATERAATEALLKEEGIAFELISPEMAQSVATD